MKPKKIYILANAKARKINFAGLQSTAKRLSKHLPIEIIKTTSYEQAISLTKQLTENPENIVAACGGDGTVNTVVNAKHQNAVLGIIPCGTANVAAKELGIEQSLTEALKLLLTGAVTSINTGVCNGKKFVFAAGFGFDAEAAAEVNPLLKRALGKAAYALSAIKVLLTYAPPKIKIMCDNKAYLGEFVIAANMRRYGGDLFFAPNARYDDGLIDVVILKKFNLPNLLKMLNYARKLTPLPSCVEQLTAKNVVLSSDRKIKYQLDGEVLGCEKEFNISLSNEQTRFITP